MTETLTRRSINESLEHNERTISAMEREAIVLKHFGVTAVNAASSPLENQIYNIDTLDEPIYND